ncbi:cytochrome c oxidase subunit 3 [Rhizobium tubonense]|uniref:Cytochrome C oxidase subunit III n=1 Tax=Rhizobium tubonense TaxID=484088 RepID=A0A2W4CDR5_9HYPH|nr:cytochrome c oxidase subunit 3 [Rhizobium tubonense]PZM08925.1 cytochrome C oxidase subunit III [Rhizobium tubonense]
MKQKVVLDVGDLTPHGMGTASPSWWGTLAFMLIEGTGFALAIIIYLYLMSLAAKWPIEAPAPDLLPGSLMTGLLAASVVPNMFLARWAKRQDRVRVRFGLIIMAILGVIPIFIRAFEFPAMHISWDQNAYGSIVWLALGLHTTHLITDLIETIVLLCLMFTRHGDNPRRYGDVGDNAMYWNFVVATWIPVYLCLYWIPRL